MHKPQQWVTSFKNKLHTKIYMNIDLCGSSILCMMKRERFGPKFIHVVNNRLIAAAIQRDFPDGFSDFLD